MTWGARAQYHTEFHFFFFKKKKGGFERGGDRKGRNTNSREIHQPVASHASLTGDLASNSSMCPDWELNQRPFPSFLPLFHLGSGERMTVCVVAWNNFHTKTTQMPGDTWNAKFSFIYVPMARPVEGAPNCIFLLDIPWQSSPPDYPGRSSSQLQGPSLSAVGP